MEKSVKTFVKTYNSNAEIFFSVDDETIGSMSVFYSSDYLDVEQNTEYNMKLIREVNQRRYSGIF